MLDRQQPDLTVKQILAPCFFVPDPSVEVPQVIAFASNPANREATTVVKARFNFQADFPECGQLSETSNLEFLAYSSSYKTQFTCYDTYYPVFNHLAHNKIFFKNNVYGAFDPEPPKKHRRVSCGQELANGYPSWITAYQTGVPRPDYDGNKECYYHSTFR
ncbi:unnamed protein product [Allacma fusca]|uniref:Uncharacterized protein n=1 Tax=Allacma fusca TaxID=39272 RepID=A0A8J2NTZ5_9HEXA|nr:unnamed protein product [Allacma fusca]